MMYATILGPEKLNKITGLRFARSATEGGQPGRSAIFKPTSKGNTSTIAYPHALHSRHNHLRKHPSQLSPTRPSDSSILQLPLSFFTSYFGMNVKQFTGDSGNLSHGRVWVFMGPISFGISTTLLATGWWMYKDFKSNTHDRQSEEEKAKRERPSGERTRVPTRSRSVVVGDNHV